MIWVMLFTGILVGWIIEWIIDTYRYNLMVERLQNEHHQAIMDVSKRYEDALEQARLRHEEYIGDLQERHRAELNLAEIEHNTRLTEQTAAHRQELEANQQHFQNELRLIESQRREELASRDATYGEAKAVLEQGYADELALLKNEHEQRLRETGASLRAEYEEQLTHARQDSAVSTQEKTGEIESRLKREYDHSLAQHDAAHRHEIALLKADYEQRLDELTLLSRPAMTNSSIVQLDSSNVSFNDGNGDSDFISHVQADDLTIIEGIGPKANNLLHDAGINSYQDLAHADIKTLQSILNEAGPRFRLLTPDTWPQQASLAAEGDWEALNQLKDKLDGGKPVAN